MLWTGWVVSVLGGALPRVGSRLNGVEKEMVKPGPERDWTGLDWRQASITLKRETIRNKWKDELLRRFGPSLGGSKRKER
ncbi:hypothetical protein GBA52_023364 [Prunus armeniaca]|nr:hypothetical protein GBA52_023364 [Prunus armeniaca]